MRTADGMRLAIFCHSLISDWNHGNAHFLRGVTRELLARGHDVRVFEPEDGWSLANLRAEYGDEAVRRFHSAFPELRSTSYGPDFDLESALDGADLVLVHEWNDHELVRRIGDLRDRLGFRLLFHDTHHRSATARDSMAQYDLRRYDGVLAFGRVIRDLYLREGWTSRAWTWHEAADTRLFRPMPGTPREGDLAWIGNWGDGERTAELEEFLLKPVRDLKLRARVYGVRYPEEARRALARAGIEYAGWLPNHEVPRVFSAFALTVHIPRGPYAGALPGVPTIRVFEALACGIPLISAPWSDVEGLFAPGDGFLCAAGSEEMKRHISALLADPDRAAAMAARGRQTVLDRHTCAHRIDELLEICGELGIASSIGAGANV